MHVACVVERRGVYRILVEKPEIKSPLARPRHRWYYNGRWVFRKWNVDYGPFPPGSG